MIREHIQHGFSSFKFVVVCFTAQSVVCHGDLKRMYILSLLAGMFYKCWLEPVGLWYCWVFICPCWFSICWFWGELLKSPNYNFRFISSFELSKFWLHTFCSSVWVIHMYLLSLGGWTFCHYTIFFSDNFFLFWSLLYLMIIFKIYSSFLLINDCMVCFFHPITFIQNILWKIHYIWI